MFKLITLHLYKYVTWDVVKYFFFKKWRLISKKFEKKNY